MALSRLGVYIRVPGVDVAKFEQSMQGGGLLGYIDALSGGSISKVGVFSLGESAFVFMHGLWVRFNHLFNQSINWRLSNAGGSHVCKVDHSWLVMQ